MTEVKCQFCGHVGLVEDECLCQGDSTPERVPDACMCLAYDFDAGEQGWRPCPSNLCERDDHQHDPDWIVSFAHAVAVERDYCAHHPGHVFLVMLKEKEAEGLLAQVNELVQRAKS